MRKQTSLPLDRSGLLSVAKSRIHAPCLCSALRLNSRTRTKRDPLPKSTTRTSWRGHQESFRSPDLELRTSSTCLETEARQIDEAIAGWTLGTKSSESQQWLHAPEHQLATHCRNVVFPKAFAASFHIPAWRDLHDSAVDCRPALESTALSCEYLLPLLSDERSFAITCNPSTQGMV